MKILTKTHVIYLKRKLRTCRIQIYVEKVWFVTKKLEKNNFQNLFFKVMSEWSKIFFSIFQIFKIFFWKMASMGRNKCWKEQSHEIWAQSEHPLRRHMRYPSKGGPLPPPSCRIGLRCIKYLKLNSWALKKLEVFITLVLKELITPSNLRRHNFFLLNNTNVLRHNFSWILTH